MIKNLLITSLGETMKLDDLNIQFVDHPFMCNENWKQTSIVEGKTNKNK